MIKRNLLVIGLAVVLSACGFQLRGTGLTKLPFKEIGVSARDAYGPTVVNLTRVLKQNGVDVHSGAPYHLTLNDEKQEERTASYSGSARSVEFDLTTTLNFTLTGLDKRELLSDSVQVEKSYVHDGNNLAGSEGQEGQVRDESRRELVQNLLVRLQQLTPAKLDELQAKADDRAKAEADAEAAAKALEDATPKQSPIQIPNQQ